MENRQSPSLSSSTSALQRIRSSVSWTALPANLDQIPDVTGRLQMKANHLRDEPPVNWGPYLETELISEEDYNFVTALQTARTRDERDKLLNDFDDAVLKSLVKVIQRVCIVEEIQKFLVLVDDLLWEDITRVYRFNPTKTEPWKAFLDLLSCTDEFVRNIASRIIAKMISMPHCRPEEDDLKYYFQWLKDELRNENIYLLSVARCLQRLLRIEEYRFVFFTLNGIFRIIRLLGIGTNQQAQYQLVYCLWISSFSPPIAERLNRFSIIPVLMENVESCPVENIKLPRVIMATFRNLLEKPREEGQRKHNAHLLIQSKILKFLDTKKSQTRMILDPEFIEDLQVIGDIMAKHVAELSTYESYNLELRSCHLEWSVVHKSKRFWEENAERFNDNKYELLKILISLLEESKDTIVLCVAAHDVGEYMSYYPRGKKVVESLGGKDALLRLLTHENPEVKYHALKSLQILMLNNYDLLIEYVSDRRSLDAVTKWNSLENFGI